MQSAPQFTHCDNVDWLGLGSLKWMVIFIFFLYIVLGILYIVPKHFIYSSENYIYRVLKAKICLTETQQKETHAPSKIYSISRVYQELSQRVVIKRHLGRLYQDVNTVHQPHDAIGLSFQAAEDRLVEMVRLPFGYRIEASEVAVVITAPSGSSRSGDTGETSYMFRFYQFLWTNPTNHIMKPWYELK